MRPSCAPSGTGGAARSSTPIPNAIGASATAALAAIGGLVGAGEARRGDAGGRRRRRGKVLTLVRLAKASGTFAGGVDYLAWKINRHAGTEIEVKPWQRRWPILGALTLLPRLLKRGAIR